jgi:RNA ligase
MENKYFKYPKTYHFPWSKPNPHGNDRVLKNIDHFIGKQIIVTEKLDGENTSMYNNYIHARSIDSINHPSRNWSKALHASIKNSIPEGWRICGENVQAKHAIHYTDLPSLFFVYGIYNENNECISWQDTEDMCNLLDLKTVPILYKGAWDEKVVKSLYTGKSVFDPAEQEGYVVRIADAFNYADFVFNVGKFVRKGHVQGSEHWTKQAYMPNTMRLKNDEL